MTISKICELVEFTVTTVVARIWIHNDGPTNVNIACEAELCAFINIFGDAAIVSIQAYIHVIVCNIRFKHLTKEELQLKVDEYIHRVYL